MHFIKSALMLTSMKKYVLTLVCMTSIANLKAMDNKKGEQETAVRFKRNTTPSNFSVLLHLIEEIYPIEKSIFAPNKDKTASAYYEHGDKSCEAGIHIKTNADQDTCQLSMHTNSEWFIKDREYRWSLGNDDALYPQYELMDYKKLTKKDLVCATLFKLLEYNTIENLERWRSKVNGSNDYSYDYKSKYTSVQGMERPRTPKNGNANNIEHEMLHTIEESLKTSLNEFEQNCSKKE